MADVAFALALNLHQPSGNLDDLLEPREREGPRAAGHDRQRAGGDQLSCTLRLSRRGDPLSGVGNPTHMRQPPFGRSASHCSANPPARSTSAVSFTPPA